MRIVWVGFGGLIGSVLHDHAIPPALMNIVASLGLGLGAI